MKAVVTFISFLILIGCSGDRANRAADSTAASVTGTVEFWEGNFMPMPPPMGPSGTVTLVSRVIRIHEATTPDQVVMSGYGAFYSEIHTPLVRRIMSDDHGRFSVQLAPGTYSLFVEEDGLYYANGWGDYIQAVTVVEGQTAETVIRINYAAYF